MYISRKQDHRTFCFVFVVVVYFSEGPFFLSFFPSFFLFCLHTQIAPVTLIFGKIDSDFDRNDRQKPLLFSERRCGEEENKLEKYEGKLIKPDGENAEIRTRARESCNVAVQRKLIVKFRR